MNTTTHSRLAASLAIGLLLGGLAPARATETENQNIRILPTPGTMVIDGKAGDWDLSGGVFVCGDVENLRDKLGVSVHAMYDAERLYVLARWLDDTPLSNPGLAGADAPWGGDSLQLRIIADPDKTIADDRGRPVPVLCWANGWRDREGKDAIDIDFPYKGGEVLKNAILKGARQACLKNADGTGYMQEMALPWTLLVDGGFTPKAGGRMIFSVEPNFNTTAGNRISLKDIFRPGVVPDRVFTFASHSCWGYGQFSPTGKVAPQKLRLADNREFPVAMRDGVPVIDWTGLFETRKMEGFAKLTLTMPTDGYVSLNIKNAEGRVVRQLLTATFLTRGPQEIVWDGLTNMSHLKPGDVVAPGAYTWEAIYHTGIGLRLVGWADNAGKTPFDSPGGNWGGDFGAPSTVTTDGAAMYLGWNGSEAGKAVVCTDFDGKVKWRHKRGGFGGASHLAAATGIVYVNDNQLNEPVLYRLDAAKGQYSYWKGQDTAVLPIAPGLAGMEAANGKLYLSYSDGVRVLDAATGAAVATIPLEKPVDLEAAKDGAVYVLCGGTRLVRLAADGTTKPVIDGLQNARGLAIGPDGTFYIGVGDPDNQVQLFSAAGAPLRTIGKQGGRPLVGLWDPSGMRFIAALRVDAKGVLWVAEKGYGPKRFSCWNAADGAFVREFFGPTNYGAPGGAISPDDPLTMIGSGCEWRLDEKTGKATCVGVFTQVEMNASRFGRGPGGRLYAAVTASFISQKPVLIYERLAAGKYKLRATLSEFTEKRAGRGGQLVDTKAGVRVWSDANDDEQEQPAEVRDYKIDLGCWLAGWYLSMTPEMIFFGSNYRIAPTGWTACGAPLYDLAQAKRLPAPDEKQGTRGVGMGFARGLGSTDGKLIVYNGVYGQDHSDFVCHDIEGGKLLWSYPNNYVGVHGGHKAPPPQAGMIRAAYDIVGTGKLPDPIGDIFAIGTDKGEWHLLTGAGFYLSKLFESDALKIRWPEMAVPGAIMDNVPPGMGAEDFGGSLTVTNDGQLYVQAGKTGYINLKVVGLESVKKLSGGALQVRESDLAPARGFRDKLLQASVPIRVATPKRRTVAFTGDLGKDFATKEPLAFQKSAADRIEVAIAYDETHLYLGWAVKDATPWVNGASDPAQMYAMGDTVDFQLGADPKADPKRDKPVLGDLRLSIGNLKGKPVAVLYRPVAAEKAPQKFFSGTVKEGYEMQSVKTLDAATLAVTVDAVGKRYVVEAAIPLAALGLAPAAGLTVTGDFGATFGDPAGGDTVLRSYWNNQATGLVADEVWELVLEPKNWGKIGFE
jgi:outer membrane protein assembly factor BamB